MTLDFGGQSITGDVTANLGGGDNTFSVLNSGSPTNANVTVGVLSVRSGAGLDQVVIGGDSKGLTFTRAAVLDTGDGQDVVVVAQSGGAGTKLASLSATLPNDITLQAGTVVTGNVSTLHGGGLNTVNLAGTVQGNAAVAVNNLTPVSSLTVSLTGTVSKDLTVNGGLNNTGDTAVTVAGSLGQRLTVTGGNGADTVSVNSAVGGAVNVSLRGGADKLTVAANVNTAGTTLGTGLYPDLGAGDDELVMNAIAILGAAVVGLGSGDDVIGVGNFTPTVNYTGSAAGLYFDAGAGSDTVNLTAGSVTAAAAGVGKFQVFMADGDDALNVTGLTFSGVNLANRLVNGGAGFNTLDSAATVTLNPVGTNGSFENQPGPAAPPVAIPPAPLPPGGVVPVSPTGPLVVVSIPPSVVVSSAGGSPAP